MSDDYAVFDKEADEGIYEQIKRWKPSWLDGKTALYIKPFDTKVIIDLKPIEDVEKLLGLDLEE